MTQPPKKPRGPGAPAGKIPGKPPPPTRRGPPTSAGGPHASPARPAESRNTLLVLGIGGGLAALALVLYFVLAGGEEHPASPGGKRKEAPAEAAKPLIPPELPGLEATGKSKCEEGLRLVQPRLNPDPSSPKDRVRNDLEGGIKLLNEGLEAYKKAASLGGKRYPVEDARQARDRALRLFCTDVETDGQKSCEGGLRIIRAAESRIIDTNKLSDEERSKLHDELKQAADQIRLGMGLLARSEAVSGHQFDVTQYQEALKVARPKIAELK
jgi:hypothetical protein